MSNYSQNNPGGWNGTVKRCLDCGETKALEDFSPAKRRLDGRASYCRHCMNKRTLESRHRRRAEAGRPVQARRVTPDGQRWCPDCETFKDLDDFPRSKGGRGGRGGYCKPCHNTRSRNTRERLYGGGREYHLRHRYGIGQVDFDRLMSAQSGLCAVCGKVTPEHVDHDHKTGRVRGLLCFNCNQALGNVRDDLLVIYRLGDYLRASRRPPGEARYLSGVEVAFEAVHRRPA